jgi:RNA polymerase sigma-70 factor (ECF subfamily)
MLHGSQALPLEEAELIALARVGDDESFARLVEIYQRPVHNLCYRMLGNAGDAEDAAQETFLRAYRHLASYDPNRKFSTWLFSIASNYCIDQHRRRRLQTYSYDALPTPDIADGAPGLETRAVYHQEQATVQRMLATLGATDRSAVVLRYWYKYSYEEIAEALGMSVSAVKSRLHRSRRELAAEWNQQDESGKPAPERKPHESPAY